MVKPGIGYIKIKPKSATTTDAIMRRSETEKQGMKSLIIDLQGNGGAISILPLHLLTSFCRQASW